jgi:Holliday junction resolvasome RuvABC endonuclease subunit
MGIILKLLARFWWLIPLAAAAAFGAWEHHEVGVVQAHATKLEKQLGSAEQSITQLQTGIQAQNVAVERILVQGQANVAAAKAQGAQRAQAAAKVQVIYRTRIERIEAAPVPQECVSAAAWAQQQAQSLAAGWSK